SVVDRVGVLVHVHDEQRGPPAEAVRVVRQPVGVRRALVWIEGEHDPARSSGQGSSRLPELPLPRFERAVVRLDHLRDRPARLAVATEVSEVEFVQHHRVGRDQLLALERARLEGRGVLDELAELLLDHVQTLHRAGIVVLVVRAEELLGQPLELRGVEGERAGLMVAAVCRRVVRLCHGISSFRGFQAGERDQPRARHHRERLASCEFHETSWSPQVAPIIVRSSRPITPAATMTSGSGTRFTYTSAPSVARAMTAVGTSTMARRPSTIPAPAMAPVAAAVTPSTNPFTARLPAKRRKYGAGMITNKYHGTNTPRAA